MCEASVEAEIVFLLDASSSIKTDEWTKLLHFVADIVESMQIGVDTVTILYCILGNIAKFRFHSSPTYTSLRVSVFDIMVNHVAR